MTRAGLVCLFAFVLTGCTEGTLAPHPDGGLDAAPRPDAQLADGGTPTPGDGGDGGLPSGWLYTQGGKIYVSDGAGGGQRFMGRGVNFDDLFLCGYNNTLWDTTAEASLTTMAAKLLSDWKPTFVRVSLGMDSYPTTTSWVSGDPAIYKTPMENVIRALGQGPGVYVLVTVRSDVGMVDQDTVDGDPEATGVPSPATDATYVALVDTFAHDGFVLFGLSNEPGGNKVKDAVLAAAMDHATATIRAEEDRLGVPHHLVSVQGNGWTSSIGYYATAPLPEDNVIYEVHGYPPDATMYTYASLPVIIGEYGSLGNGASAFYADVEAKQIPNLAWDFESFSDCTPDLLTVNQSASNLVPSAWGMTVQAYLLAHHP